MEGEIKRKLYELKRGYIGTFTKADGEKLMNEIGGSFKWDNPFTKEELINNFGY